MEGIVRGRSLVGDRRPSALEEKRKERRLSSDRRKSGPKLVDVESTRQEGRAGRRRLSDSTRRTSRGNKAAALRRERSALRPPLAGHPGIGRASLPARFPAPVRTVVGPTATAAAPRPLPPPPPTPRPAAPPSEGGGVIAMEQEEQEGERQEKGRLDEEAWPDDDAQWTPERVEEAARSILGDDTHLQTRCLRWLRVVLSLSESPPAENVVQAGLLPMLVEFLGQTERAELRPEALCALTNIASTKFTKAVAMEPAMLPTLLGLLVGPDPHLREQSAWCLGNIAADGVEMRDVVLAAGVLEPLLLSLSPSEQGSTSFMRTGTWALNNLCRGLPPPPLSTVVPIIGTLQPVIEGANTADAGTLIDAGWVLYHITLGGSDRIDAVRAAGLLTMMPDMLLHDSAQVVRPVIRAMENLACSSADHREALIEAGVLDPLVETLGHDSSKVRANALRLLSCIAAGSPEQVEAVASTGDVIPCVTMELEEGNALCRKEAAWVFLNVCECGRDAHRSIIPDMVESGVISAVCQNLHTDADAETLLVMLSLLYAILDVGGEGPELSRYLTLVDEAGGFDRVVCLANDHDDMEIYDKAMDIIQSFGDRDSDEEVDDQDDHAHDDHLSFHARWETAAAAEASAPAPRHAGGGGGGQDAGFGRGHEDDGMSDGSMSDDSFHKELADTSGPITPPPQIPPSSSSSSGGVPPPPLARLPMTSASTPPLQQRHLAEPPAAGASEGRRRRNDNIGVGEKSSPVQPRRPLGAVQQYPTTGDNGSSSATFSFGIDASTAAAAAAAAAAGGGGVRSGLTAAAAGGRGEGKGVTVFRDSEGDKTE